MTPASSHRPLSNGETDRRIRAWVDRNLHPERRRQEYSELRVMNATELSAEERAAYGFPPDFVPRPSSQRKRGR